MDYKSKEAAPAKAAPSNRALSWQATHAQYAKFHRVSQLRIILDALVGAADEAPSRDLELRWRDLGAGCADLISAERRAAFCGRAAR